MLASSTIMLDEYLPNLSNMRLDVERVGSAKVRPSRSVDCRYLNARIKAASVLPAPVASSIMNIDGSETSIAAIFDCKGEGSYPKISKKFKFASRFFRILRRSSEKILSACFSDYIL